MITNIVDGITFDDILLQPKLSAVHSRKDINIGTSLVNGISLKAPIISSNMDTVTELVMAETMARLGGVGVIHRFLGAEEHVMQLTQLSGPRILAIGVKEEDWFRINLAVHVAAVDVFLIDVAHGHHIRVIERIRDLKTKFPSIPIIAGNVATKQGALDLFNAGADAVKAGIGPSAVCSTRTVAGVGVPQLTAIQQVAEAKFEIEKPGYIIADGGLRSSGDIVKALAFGADSVMIGGLFSGTLEAPGEVIKLEGKDVKYYRGMASEAAQRSIGISRAPEGVETTVPYKGSVEAIFNNLCEGIRSGLSYLGCANLDQLDENNITAIRQTMAGINESRHYGK